MPSKLQAIILILIFNMASACQKSPSQGPGHDPSIEPVNPQVIGEPRLPPLICADHRPCPEAIGELITITSLGMRFCTASLVAPDVILTASHCVPFEHIGPDQLIQGRCWVRWPERNPRQQSPLIPCQSLISASELRPVDDPLIREDRAFIRLAQPITARRPLRVQRNPVRGLIPRGSVAVYGVDPADEAHRVERQVCLRNDAFELPGKQLGSDQAIILPRCRVKPGYSGGPILDLRTLRIIGVTSFIRSGSEDRRPGLAVGTGIEE